MKNDKLRWDYLASCEEAELLPLWQYSQKRNGDEHSKRDCRVACGSSLIDIRAWLRRVAEKFPFVIKGCPVGAGI